MNKTIDAFASVVSNEPKTILSASPVRRLSFKPEVSEHAARAKRDAPTSQEKATSAAEASLSARIAELEAQLATANAKAKTAPRIGFKVSEKGALSAYGMGRFPVTLYRSQWEGLAKAMPELLAFIEANADKLATKP